MDAKSCKRLAKKTVKGIVDDIRDRRGLGDEWDQIDSDIRKEILKSWEAMVGEALEEVTDSNRNN